MQMDEFKNSMNDDEITLKEIIQKLKIFYHEVLKNWYLVLLFCLPITTYFIYKHFQTKDIYNAETKFLVEGSSGGSGISGLLGQFGIRSSGKFNPYKVIEVAKSKVLIKKVLFKKLNNDYLINQIIQQYNLDEQWAKNKPEWKGFRFKNSEFDSFTEKESQAFVGVINVILGGKKIKNPLLSFGYDEDTGIFSYNVSTQKEDLTMALINNAYSELKYFFEEEIVSGQLGTTVILKQKADSIQSLINRKSIQIASHQDQTLGLVYSTPGAKKSILEKEIQALTIAYAEVLKSYEMADINLKDTRPMFLKLDESLDPLEPVQSSLIINIIKGFLIGFIIAIIFIISRFIIRNALNN